MKKIFIILSLFLTLSYPINKIEKLKIGCDIGYEKACQKLIELKQLSEPMPKSDHDDEYDSIVCDKNVLKTYPNIINRHNSANWLEIKSSFERNGWKSTGVTPQDAFRWRDLDFSIGDVDKLKLIGINTPAKAKKWVCVGMKSGREFMGISLGTPFLNNVSIAHQNNISRNEAYAWYKIGLLPGQIVKWKKLGVKSSNTAKRWVGLGVVHSKQLERWVNAEIKDPTIAKKWMQIIKVRNKRKQTYNAINSSDSLQGDYLHSIFFWQQIKVYNPDEAKEWMILKLRTDQVEKWKKYINTPEEASDWLKEGFVLGYLWKAKGFSIEEGKRWKEARIFDGYLFNPKMHTIKSVLKYKKCMKHADKLLSEDLRIYSHNNEAIDKIYYGHNIWVTNCKNELNKKDNTK